MAMSVEYAIGDLPEGFEPRGSVAIDTETMGLNLQRDRLCLVQLCDEGGRVCLVHFPRGTSYDAPRLRALLQDTSLRKIFHFGRFDVGVLWGAFRVVTAPVVCTKIASKLVRTYTDRHGLKDLCRELLGEDLSKQEQSSDWGAPLLTGPQKEYAARDVIYLHRLWEKLEQMLCREERFALAESCFDFLPTRALLDANGWNHIDIFEH